MKSVFFSYSHKDEDLRNELQKHLVHLKRTRRISMWSDHRIGAGDEFSGAISENLKSADIVLLLVSPDFIASDYCYDIEMATAIQRHDAKDARVIPVILRPCDWHDTPFGKLKALPTDGKPVTTFSNHDEAFLDIVKHLKKVLPSDTENGISGSDPKVFTTKKVTQHTNSNRSSNLGIRKRVTDREKDEFLDKTFSFIKDYFMQSLIELERRYSEISTKFIDGGSQAFSCIVYSHDTRKSECSVFITDSFGSASIGYNIDANLKRNQTNEQLTVNTENDEITLASGFGSIIHNKGGASMGHKEAADHLWDMFIEPLQR